MKYQDLISQFIAEPSDANFVAMKIWLDKRHKDSPSVYEVLFALIKHRPEPSVFEWVGHWLEPRDWFPLASLVHVVNADWHKWLIEYASNHPDATHTGTLWREFLISFRYQSLVDCASSWLVNQGEDEAAVQVAELLLPMTKDIAAQRKAIELLRRFPNEFNTATLVQHAGDAESIQLGLKILSTAEEVTGTFLAVALLKKDTASWPAIERWLKTRWNGKRIQFALEMLVEEAPDIVAPLAMKWIDEHPRAKDISRIFRTAFTLKPSPELYETLWSWLETRTDKKYCPEILSVLFNHWGKFKGPVGATQFAATWLAKNENHPLYSTILLGAIGEESTDSLVKRAQKWLEMTEDVDKGFMLMNLRRKSPNYFTDEALDWAYRHAETIDAQVIKYEYFRDTKNKRQVTVEEIDQFVSEHLFSDERLCALIEVKDEDAIKWAKALVQAPRVDFKFARSGRCRKAPVLAALHRTLPNDGEVDLAIKNWFDSDEDVCADHMEEMLRVRNATGDRYE